VAAEATPNRLWENTFYTPASLYAESTYFTSRYGNRRTYIGQGTDLKFDSFHTGLDFGGGTGLPITAPAPGVVVFADDLVVRGKATIIDHGWGVYSGFWHQSEIQVTVGQRVEQGDVIGLVGGTGRVTGAHLHWEIWVNGIQVDPLDWLEQVYPRE
jgi:murein DD-endopeptidase MepM/ murein hydrolase activator NlpD